MDVGAADMLRATFELRLEGLSEAIASSSLRLPRFFSTAINRSEKKSAYILASHCEGKKKDNRNDSKETTGWIQASFTVQGFFSIFAPDNGTIPGEKNRHMWRVWSVYIPPLSPPSVAFRSAIRRPINSTTACRDLFERVVRILCENFKGLYTTYFCSFSESSLCSFHRVSNGFHSVQEQS